MIAGAVFVLGTLIRIHSEEKLMRATFGERAVAAACPGAALNAPRPNDRPQEKGFDAAWRDRALV